MNSKDRVTIPQPPSSRHPLKKPQRMYPISKNERLPSSMIYLISIPSIYAIPCCAVPCRNAITSPLDMRADSTNLPLPRPVRPRTMRRRRSALATLRARARTRSIINPIDNIRLDNTDGRRVAEDLVPVGRRGAAAWRRGPRRPGAGAGLLVGHVWCWCWWEALFWCWCWCCVGRFCLFWWDGWLVVFLEIDLKERSLNW